jgi:hypothetical protein
MGNLKVAFIAVLLAGVVLTIMLLGTRPAKAGFETCVWPNTCAQSN